MRMMCDQVLLENKVLDSNQQEDQQANVAI